MKKNYLFTPGPTMVPPEVSLAEAQPMIHHRTPQFSQIFYELSEDLKYLFQTKTGEVYTLMSSGTGAMEACVANVLSKGDKALVITSGKFGERWVELCKCFGIETEVVSVEYGKGVEPSRVEEILKKNSEIKVVFATQSETSTGALHDIKAISQIVKKYSALIVVDAITGIGVHKFLMDEWNVDVAVTGSQKGCMLPPGLAFVCVNSGAWEAVEKGDLPRYYWDFRKMRKNLKNKTTPFTPAVSLVMAMKTAMEMIKKEGIENVWARHERLANATREGVKALGLELFAGNSSSNVLTAIKAPEGVDVDKIIKKLRDETGVTFTGGQDSLKGKMIRIGHMGYVNDFDIILAISALEKGLHEAGYPVELGKGITRVQSLLVKGR
ncbi:serine-pyruvate aminotransferase [Candidatus Kuenenia stuttgartiensis]|jgi:aspartate aminotransferase-like enzyme|uniref:Serine-pyruvate aminotransferase n=1 Tax=Kuenenia stuttgartiensis TaxID=174633 RepID=Q1PXR8_KUEST|nr:MULTISPECIES: alanine--glyoxylate aminotransferase family protein [Kuenenia]MBE7546436.1 alanine--glyoxylate aminotransferase family protein [Planctomycetia bacterium]MBW7942221.1 alanine--glyoxylate aminotransferase family protein [Candidatus Kuenenia stuttgartiensis]MBZ0190140.1 alanine--glyoxylate aminotransferase family protein [Candidatus Kuenenia stuttgartiensis]MCF6151095.1 alanine--glyoxylate aminotransferase family protein [Candidatus Kuenenia stuttgartiensis]MCL4725687.1 alanine--